MHAAKAKPPTGTAGGFGARILSGTDLRGRIPRIPRIPVFPVGNSSPSTKQMPAEHGGHAPETALFEGQQHFIDTEDKYGAHNYHPLPVVLEKGERCFLWDMARPDLISG
eukprot:g13546.t1